MLLNRALAHFFVNVYALLFEFFHESLRLTESTFYHMLNVVCEVFGLRLTYTGLYFSGGPPLCSADPNHLCNFGRRYHEKQFCEIILNLDQWFRRNCRPNVFLIWISGSPFVQHKVTIFAILLEGIMRNNSVKLF